MNGIPIKASNQYLKKENKIPTPNNSAGFAYSEKSKIIAESLVPIPPNVTGIWPMSMAIGIFAIIKNKGTSIPNAENNRIICTTAINQKMIE